MRGQTREKGPSRFRFKTGSGQPTRWLHCMDPKPGHNERMPRNTNRSEKVFLQKIPLSREWTDEPSIAFPIHAKCLARIFDGVVQNCCGAVVKRMGERVGRINPLETVLV
jgi:hypothetical protein